MSSNNSCFYCQKYRPDPTLTFKATLYHKLDSNLGIGLTGLKRTTRYLEKEIQIERCATCYTEHHRANRPAFRIGLIFLLLSGPIIYFFALRVYIAVFGALAIGFLAYLLYFGTVYRKRIGALGIKDQNDFRSYPPVRALLDQGWETIKP